MRVAHLHRRRWATRLSDLVCASDLAVHFFPGKPRDAHVNWSGRNASLSWLRYGRREPWRAKVIGKAPVIVGVSRADIHAMRLIFRAPTHNSPGTD